MVSRDVTDYDAEDTQLEEDITKEMEKAAPSKRSGKKPAPAGGGKKRKREAGGDKQRKRKMTDVMDDEPEEGEIARPAKPTKPAAPAKPPTKKAVADACELLGIDSVSMVPHHVDRDLKPDQMDAIAATLLPGLYGRSSFTTLRSSVTHTLTEQNLIKARPFDSAGALLFKHAVESHIIDTVLLATEECKRNKQQQFSPHQLVSTCYELLLSKSGMLIGREDFLKTAELILTQMDKFAAPFHPFPETRNFPLTAAQLTQLGAETLSHLKDVVAVHAQISHPLVRHVNVYRLLEHTKMAPYSARQFAQAAIGVWYHQAMFNVAEMWEEIKKSQNAADWKDKDAKDWVIRRSFGILLNLQPPDDDNTILELDDFALARRAFYETVWRRGAREEAIAAEKAKEKTARKTKTKKTREEVEAEREAEREAEAQRFERYVQEEEAKDYAIVFGKTGLDTKSSHGTGRVPHSAAEWDYITKTVAHDGKAASRLAHDWRELMTPYIQPLSDEEREQISAIVAGGGPSFGVKRVRERAPYMKAIAADTARAIHLLHRNQKNTTPLFFYFVQRVISQIYGILTPIKAYPVVPFVKARARKTEASQAPARINDSLEL